MVGTLVKRDRDAQKYVLGKDFISDRTASKVVDGVNKVLHGGSAEAEAWAKRGRPEAPAMQQVTMDA